MRKRSTWLIFLAKMFTEPFIALFIPRFQIILLGARPSDLRLLGTRSFQDLDGALDGGVFHEDEGAQLVAKTEGERGRGHEFRGGQTGKRDTHPDSE